MLKLRYPRARKGPAPRITDEQYSDIINRWLEGFRGETETIQEIADSFGVSRATISRYVDIFRTSDEGKEYLGKLARVREGIE